MLSTACVRERFGPLDPRWRRLQFAAARSESECVDMLRDLEGKFGGERGAAQLIGVSVLTLRSWRERQSMSVPSRRVIWLIWALVSAPEQLATVWDVMMWGRFTGNAAVRKRVAQLGRKKRSRQSYVDGDGI